MFGGNSLFGKPATQQPTTGNLFGNQPQGGLFGQSNNNPQQAQGNNLWSNQGGKNNIYFILERIIYCISLLKNNNFKGFNSTQPTNPSGASGGLFGQPQTNVNQGGGLFGQQQKRIFYL